MKLISIFKRVIFFSGITIFFLSIFFPWSYELSSEAQRSIGVFSLGVSLWITGYLAPAITGLLIIGIIPVLGILDPKDTFSFFGNKAIFFILGAFILSSGLMKSGFAKRAGIFFLNIFSNSPFKILFGVLFTSFFLSLFMPEHAVATMLFPVVLKLTHELNIPKEKIFREFEGLLFLCLAWGCVIGGIGTPLGGARAPLAIGLLYEEFKISINFAQWTLFSLPLSLLIFSFAVIYIYFLSKKFRIIFNFTLQENKNRLPLSLDERKTIGIFILALFFWIFLNQQIDMSVTAVLAGVLLFVFKVLNWKDIESYANWGIILMYGGAIVLAKTLDETGAAEWLVHNFLFSFAQTQISIFFIFAITSILLTEVMSNVATVAFLLPIVYGFVEPVRANPFLITLAVALPSGLAFLLPIGTPANAIAFSSGKYSVGYAIKRGFIFIVFSILFLFILAKFIWPLLGVKL